MGMREGNYIPRYARTEEVGLKPMRDLLKEYGNEWERSRGTGLLCINRC